MPSIETLTDLQLAVMRVLWGRGESSVAEVQAGLGRELAYTTVATLLKRLEEASLVTRRQDGRQHLYQAAVSEQRVQRSMTRRLIDTLFGGRPGALVEHLVSAKQLAPGDLDELDALLEATDDAPPEPDEADLNDGLDPLRDEEPCR